MQGLPTIINAARELLPQFGNVRPQPSSDWRGTFALPDEVAAYYAEIGPCDIWIEGYGNPYFLPRLGGLWDFQRGYRWHGETGERIEEWDDAWLVIADQGGDAFIFDRTSGRILFALHGQGVWEPRPCFPNPPTMAACIGILGNIVREAGKNFTDSDCLVRPEYRERAISAIADIVGTRSDAGVIMESACWS
jgi:hypothetical protein